MLISLNKKEWRNDDTYASSAWSTQKNNEHANKANGEEQMQKNSKMHIIPTEWHYFCGKTLCKYSL